MKSGPRLTPRLLLAVALGMSLAESVRAADPQPPEPVARTLLTRDQLDQLLGPIALYPDALIALILPAATEPTEVVLAARFIDAKSDAATIDSQPWSDSVKGLARYPDIIKWMDLNLEWTRQVGESFLDQPAELMNAVQRLRATARATGALVDTPQQQVVVDGDAIEILPTQNDVIYVPRYDPEVVYVMPAPGYYPAGPYVTFGVGFPIGLWLDYDFDWHRRVIWVGDRRHDWRDHRDWRRQQPRGQPSYPNNPNWHAWSPPANRPPPRRDTYRHRPEIERPRPMAGAPINPRPPGSRDANRPPRHDDGNRPPRTDGGNRPPQPDGGVPAPRPENNNRPPRRDHPTPPSPTAVPRVQAQTSATQVATPQARPPMQLPPASTFSNSRQQLTPPPAPRVAPPPSAPVNRPPQVNRPPPVQREMARPPAPPPPQPSPQAQPQQAKGREAEPREKQN